MRRNETRTPSPKLRTWRAFIAASILITLASIGMAQTISLTDDEGNPITDPVFGQDIQISATGAFSSDTDYRIGFIVMNGTTVLSRSDMSVSDTIIVTSASDTGLSPTTIELKWGSGFTTSNSDWADWQLGTYPVKLFIVSSTSPDPTTDNELTTNTVAYSGQITPGKDNQAGTLSFDGFGYDDDTPGGFVSGGDVLIDGNNLGGASGPNAAGTVSVNLAPIASGTAFDAFWTAYLEGTHLSLKNGITLPADGDFSDEAATVPALAVGDVAVAHWYEANNAIGYAIVSDTSITPSDEATITVSPQDVTVKEISPAEFTVSATGNGTVTVQWQVSASDAGWADITGATSTTYTISETEETDDGTQYRVLVINEETDEGPRVITSRVATLTVSPVSVIPVIGTQPSNTDVVAGEDATFTVVMSPTSTFFSYQWYRKDAGSETWTSITDATTTTLTLEDVILDDDGTQVYVEITSKETGKETVVVDSNTATLTVNSAGAPTDVLVFTDTETAWVTFKAPTGINISKYQYDISGDTKDWIDVESTSNIITISGLDDGDYTIKVRAYSDLIGAGKASETIEFTVGAATKPGATATVLNDVAAGGSTYADGTVTFSFDISVTYTGDEAANDLWLDLRNIDTSESVTAVKTNNSDGTISKVGDVWLWRDAALEKNDTATLTLTIEIEVE